MHYVTIVAENYLPQALTLHASIQRVEPAVDLTICLVDAPPPVELQQLPGLQWLSPRDALAPRLFDELATMYTVVELCTAIKPKVLQHLVADHGEVAYLDPDTYLLSPLSELPELLRWHSAVLTPHFLQPIAPGSAIVSENHCLTVGVFNLGFCAVGTQSADFLEWWWTHLESECLIYPLLGLFVDQKWVDASIPYFNHHILKHPGYNVGPWNLHERKIDERIPGGYSVNGDDLRLFHFSGFDPLTPGEVTVRLNVSTSVAGLAGNGLPGLYEAYAEQLLANGGAGIGGKYAYDVDQRGNRMTQRLRRAYRAARLEQGSPVPNAVTPGDANAFAEWRQGRRGAQAAQAVADAAIAAKYAFPDTFNKVRRASPGSFRAVRARLLAQGRVRR